MMRITLGSEKRSCRQGLGDRNYTTVQPVASVLNFKSIIRVYNSQVVKETSDSRGGARTTQLRELCSTMG